MKKMFAAAAAALLLVGLSAPAMAGSCPKLMKSVDAALATNPKLTADQMSQVKALRAKGEEQHKAGQHKASVESLNAAQKLLGVKM